MLSINIFQVLYGSTETITSIESWHIIWPTWVVLKYQVTSHNKKLCRSTFVSDTQEKNPRVLLTLHLFIGSTSRELEKKPPFSEALIICVSVSTCLSITHHLPFIWSKPTQSPSVTVLKQNHASCHYFRINFNDKEETRLPLLLTHISQCRYAFYQMQSFWDFIFSK